MISEVGLIRPLTIPVQREMFLSLIGFSNNEIRAMVDSFIK